MLFQVNFKGFHMNKGYTWLEMLSVLIIFSLLLGLAYPHWQPFLYQVEDNILKNQLLEMIHYAQSEADLLLRPVAICQSQNQSTCGGEWQQGQLIFRDDDEDGLLHDASQIIRVALPMARHGKLNWRAYPHYRQTWLFYPSDLFKTDNATLWHCHQQRIVFALITNQTGRVRIMEPDANGEIKDGEGRALACL
jgi:Tfp pilus assembly protein FimT